MKGLGRRRRSEGRRYWGNESHERAREQVIMSDNILFRNEQHTWMLLL